MQIKRLRERIEFAVNQLRQAISEQKETISHSLIYIQRACNESIENSIQKQIDWLQSQTNNKLKIILQLIQQNAENIKKKINAKQITENAQILQKTQVSQTSQVMQNSQKSTQKLTYAQKAAQVTSANANANTNANTNANMNANADEWNLIIKKPSPKSQEISYRERRLIVTSKNDKMLTTNLLQAMLVRRAEQSHQHQQSSNSALLMHWAHTQLKSETITTQSSTHWSLHIHRRTATSLHTCCDSYTTYTHILRRHDSAFAHIWTDVMQ